MSITAALGAVGSFLGSSAGQVAAGIGSSILGNLFGARNQDKANQTNLKINQLNNEFNERMMQKQMDYNTMMWNKQNAYNTPVQQMQRLKDAGLNPYMMLNGGNAGNASSAGSISAASAAPSSPQQAFLPDFSGIPQSILISKQGANIDADTNSKVIDNQTRLIKNLQEIAHLRAQTNDKTMDAALKRSQYSVADELNMLNVQQKKEEIANIRELTENLVRDRMLKDKNLAIFDEQKRLEFSQISSVILFNHAETGKSKQQTVHEIEKLYETVARRQGLQISNEVAKRTADAIVEKYIQDTLPAVGRFGENIGDWFNKRKYGQYK